MPATECIAGRSNPIKNPLPCKRACFSFAAFSKSLIFHLQSSGIPVAAGLSDAEFKSIESSHGFRFPPDLHSILREGLPVGSGFPNWRFSSPQQLQILLSLPISGLLKLISRKSSSGRNPFWPPAWGSPPDSQTSCISLARSILAGAPKLIPIYRNFYIAATANNIAGNPVFRVDGNDVSCCGYDLADFFYREETALFTPSSLPSWAATEARRVEVWTDLASGFGDGLDTWMKGIQWRLREGGWREGEVREMLMMGESDGGEDGRRIIGRRMKVKDRVEMLWRVRVLALVLLRGGWRAEDVVYSLGGGKEEAAVRSVPVTWQVDTSMDEISFNFF